MIVAGIDVPTRPYSRPCDQCGTEFRVLPADVRKALKRGCNPPRFCSRACRDVSSAATATRNGAVARTFRHRAIGTSSRLTIHTRTKTDTSQSTDW